MGGYRMAITEAERMMPMRLSIYLCGGLSGLCSEWCWYAYVLVACYYGMRVLDQHALWSGVVGEEGRPELHRELRALRQTFTPTIGIDFALEL